MEYPTAWSGWNSETCTPTGLITEQQALCLFFWWLLAIWNASLKCNYTMRKGQGSELTDVLMLVDRRKACGHSCYVLQPRHFWRARCHCPQSCWNWYEDDYYYMIAHSIAFQLFNQFIHSPLRASSFSSDFFLLSLKILFEGPQSKFGDPF